VLGVTLLVALVVRPALVVLMAAVIIATLRLALLRVANLLALIPTPTAVALRAALVVTTLSLFLLALEGAFRLRFVLAELFVAAAFGSAWRVAPVGALWLRLAFPLRLVALRVRVALHHHVSRASLCRHDYTYTVLAAGRVVVVTLAITPVAMLVLWALHHPLAHTAAINTIRHSTYLVATLSTMLVVAIPITTPLITHHHLLVPTPLLLILRAAVEARTTMLLRRADAVIAPVMEALLAPVGAASVAIIFILSGNALLGVEDVGGDGEGKDERCDRYVSHEV
jgi:hypothetical protein